MATPSRKRKAPARPTNTRERLLAAAIELFAKHGFAGTTTRQIARKARRNEALIFRHFPTKRDLYAAIIQHKISQSSAIELLEAVNDVSADDESFFKNLAQRIYHSKSSDPQFIRLLYFSALEGHELADLFFETYAQQLRASLQSYLQRGVDEGRFRAIDPVLMGRAFIGMLAHYQVTRELFSGCQALPEPALAVDVFVEIFLRGIVAPAPKKAVARRPRKAT